MSLGVPSESREGSSNNFSLESAPPFARSFLVGHCRRDRRDRDGAPELLWISGSAGSAVGSVDGDSHDFDADPVGSERIGHGHECDLRERVQRVRCQLLALEQDGQYDLPWASFSTSSACATTPIPSMGIPEGTKVESCRGTPPIARRTTP